MIKIIEDNGVVYAKLIKSTHRVDDREFFTDSLDEIQLGVVNYKQNHKTGAHYHNHLKAKSNRVDEIYIIQNGSLRVDLYSEIGAYIKSIEANSGDILILYCGGHNIMFTQDTKVFKIKPGIYEQKTAKTRIVGANNSHLVIDKD